MTFIQPILMITFFHLYFISFFELIIHNIPTRCKIAFNTNLVIISSNVEVPENKPVSFLQVIYLLSMTSKCYLSPIKHNSKMANTLNNDTISPFFVFIIFAVCSIMVIKGNQLIVYFIDVGQYDSLSLRLNFFSKGFYSLTSIFFLYSAESRFSFHS